MPNFQRLDVSLLGGVQVALAMADRREMDDAVRDNRMVLLEDAPRQLIALRKGRLRAVEVAFLLQRRAQGVEPGPPGV